MNKNLVRILSLVLTFVMAFSMVTTVFATLADVPTPDTNIQGGEGLTGTVGAVLGVIQFVGYAFAVGMLIYIGIKYMMSSANEKADLKKGAINYVIGAILVFAAASVVGIIKSLSGNVKGEE